MELNIIYKQNIKTCIEKYGCENPRQNKEIKSKIKETCLEKYGCENPMQNEDVKSKAKETCFEKYGVECSSKNEDVQAKIRETNLKNHGVEYPMQNEDIKEKTRAIWLENYGVEHPMQNEDVKLKAKKNRIKNGTQIPDNQLTDFEKYRKTVRNETDKYKKQLFELWDGNDHYDLKYIKDNLILLSSSDRSFPTIDHKISIYEGFINKIPKEIIGNIDNLCVTKRFINISKSTKLYSDFLEYFKNHPPIP